MSHSSRVPNLSAGRIALGYTVLAILWIAFSDAAVIRLKLPAALMTIKGTLFVFVTAALLYLTIRRLVLPVQKAAQQASRLAAIVESSEDAILSKTLEGVIVSWNKGAEKIYGYRAEEVIGKPVAILADPGGPDETLQLLTRVGRGESVNHYETVRRRKDGKSITLSLALSPIRDASGGIVGASTVARDISERKKAEETIRQHEMELRQVLDFTPLLVAVFGPNRERLYANQPTLDYFGVTLQEWQGFSDRFHFFHPDDRERLAEDVYTGGEKKVPHQFEARFRKSDGTYRWF